MDWRHVPDMTLDDCDRLVASVKASEHHVKKTKIMGGEPTIHNDFVEIARRFKTVSSKVWIVTNGMITDLPDLPGGCTYKRMVLDQKDHHAFFVSPTDIGMGHLIKDINQCTAMLLCGRGVEPEGFMQCSVARSLLEARGIDPAPYISPDPVTEPDMEICKHCPLSLGTKKNKGLTWRVAAGEVECPSKSFTALKSNYKIMERADKHIRRAEEKGLVEIVPSGEMITSIKMLPDGWRDHKPVGIGE